MHKRFVVYTVVVGNYDVVRQPAVIDDRFDYILFSDSTMINPGVWQIRQIPYVSSNNVFKARYPRINARQVLSEYEASLYIDGNVQITSQNVYNRFAELVENGVEWASIKHQGRKGLYSELNAIIGLGWVHDYEVIDWYKFLRKEKFPDENGLFENNVIFRTHTQQVDKVNSIWWSTMKQFALRRDQFSLMYALWKVPEIKTDFFLTEHENAWHNKGFFMCANHCNHKREVERTLWEKLRDRYVRMFYSSGDWEIYYTRWFDKLIKWPFPHLAMHVWTMYIMLRYDMGFLMRRAECRIKKCRI